MSMHVSFTRTGGFAGMTLRWESDLDQLGPDEARQLMSLIDAGTSQDAQSGRRAPAGAADQFEYVIEVERDGKRQRIVTSDATMSETLQPLVTYLSKQARQARRGKAGA